MHIRKLRTNHIETPMGYTFDPLTLSWITESTGKEQAFARITISTESDFSTIVYDSGKGQLDSVAFHPDIDLMPMTRYYWQVEVTADDGDSSQARSFLKRGKWRHLGPLHGSEHHLTRHRRSSETLILLRLFRLESIW